MKILLICFVSILSLLSLNIFARNEKYIEGLNSPTEKRTWTCHAYPQFAIWELDTGEKGASEIKIRRLSKDISSHDKLCKDNSHKNDIFLKDFDGYFEGVFENIILVTSPDSFGGIMSFSAHDALSGKKLFTSEYNSDIETKVIIKNIKGKISLSFYRPLKVNCTPTKQNTACWKQILKENKIPENIKIDLPDCKTPLRKYQDNPNVQITTNIQINDIFNPQIQYLGGRSTCSLEP
jgi:hypothetical protein